MAIKYLSEAHPEIHPVVSKGGRWSNAGRRKQQQHSDVLGMLGVFERGSSLCGQLREIAHWIQEPHIRPDAPRFRKACHFYPDGRRIAGSTSQASGSAPGGRQAAQSPSRHGAHGYFPSDGEVRSLSSGPCVSRSWCRSCGSVAQRGTTPAEEESGASSGSNFSEESGVPGESQLEGEGVAEAIGVIRACQNRGESLWTPGVICRLFETPELPHKVFPEAAKAMAEQAAAAPEATAIDPTAAGSTPAVVPPTPGTEPKSPHSLPSVIFRPGRLIEKTLMIEAADGSSVPVPPAIPEEASAPSAASGAFVAKLSEPWPDSRGARVCASEATACGYGLWFLPRVSSRTTKASWKQPALLSKAQTSSSDFAGAEKL